MTNTTIDPVAPPTELAEAQKRLDDAMAQLATAIPGREVRALGSRINDLLAAFARATKRESGVDKQAAERIINNMQPHFDSEKQKFIVSYSELRFAITEIEGEQP